MVKVIALVVILLYSCSTPAPKKASIEVKKGGRSSATTVTDVALLHPPDRKGENIVGGDLVSPPTSFDNIINLMDQVLQKKIKIDIIPQNPHLKTVYIVATGDIIPHGAVKQSGRLNIDGTFKKTPDFTEMFKGIKPLIQGNDIAFANLETPYEKDTFENMYKSIPYKFNIPIEMLKALKSLGFTVFSLANNHMYDQGTDGIKSTIDILDTLQFNHLGAAENYKNAIKPIIIEKKGIKIGFIAFTTWINNDKNHKDSENCYKHILVKTHGHASQQEKEKKKITKPKKACIDYPYINRYYDKVAKKSIEELRKKVDFLIVSTHWGHEYHKEPSFEQKRKAKIFIKSGADLILGHHPHALQPLVYKDGAYIVYSMGNFISNQFFDVRSKYSRHKNSNREGIIYRFSLERNKDKKVVIKEINYRPIYIYQEKLEKNPLKISESYKIQLKQPEKSSDEYKKLTAFIGPTKIKVKIMKNLITRRVKNLIDFILSQI